MAPLAKGEPDRYGNRTIDVYLQAVPEPREPRRELVTVNDEGG